MRPKYPPQEGLIGYQFGRLIVTEHLGQDHHRHSIYLCECDCGEKLEIVRTSLVSNRTFSCGCYKSERMSESPNNFRNASKNGRLIRNKNRYFFKGDK